MIVGGAAATVAAAGWAASPVARADNIGGLRSAVRGRVWLPSDPEFERAKTPWLLTVDQSVRAVVHVADDQDAAALIGFAADHGVALSTQPTGHGASSAANGTILVRTGALDRLAIDPGARLARVGAGVSWGSVQSAAAPHGLTGVAGSSPGVGVTGYTLGGGLSWFGRAHGWAAGSVSSLDIVDAAGQPRRVTADSDPDLFWALRGGGGDFAFVTGLEFGLKPAPAVYGGRMTWPADRAESVFAAFDDVTSRAPDELSVWYVLSQFPGAPPAVGIYCAFLGGSDEGRQLLAPFDGVGNVIEDNRRMLSPAELGSISAEPEHPSAALQRGTLITDLSPSIIAEVLSTPLSPLMYLQVRQLGGQLTEPVDIAADPLTARYYMQMGGIRTAPSSVAAVADKMTQIGDLLASVDTHRTPFNFLNESQTAADAFADTTLERLRAVKTRHDPAGVFRSNFGVNQRR
ncbi:FAD-binding oxidoreductase [Mycobacterium avium]|uniref:FAD-binding oxidoreductase n=1 Tax=Mycobacterium avium TaxID=1764 RepID=UPI0003D1D04F|nr:FAD-binding oxidoreductase [Mycobacterium avium]ETA90115.1 FAD-linked oxidase [Mycobacterium avium 05-4293]MDV3303008.1 FAD-binding oxidoreductase [Mycobacterium avium subsp. hominissuis]PBA13782.1 FAD-binding oxidoreductase [Mycobacterium avium]PBA89824.1 FAD-binding oxidoreductase [Mycobacterium avium]PBJ47002.1 FAD-binding oxidoreductase [Mycobacterium avium subsp. hominissuis]